MPRPTSRWLCPFTALAIFASPAALAQDAPQGLYAVVDHRIASGVAATADAHDAEARRQELGHTVRYGDILTWYDGRTCDDWQASAGHAPDPAAADPNLADLQLGLGTGGAPENTPILLTCAGAPFASVVRVDARVQLAFVPNGTMYVVLERVPSPEEIRELQAALQAHGHYEGRLDGRLTEHTRDAIAAFVASYAAPQPLTGVVTQAVFEALQLD